jgi:hypothetical protein
VAALVVFFIYLGARIYVATHAPWRGDFGVYYRAGQDMAAGKPLYYVDFGIEETFKYAPVEALALTAIHWLPPRAARLVWYLVDLSLLGVIFAVSYRMVYPDGRWTAHRGWLTWATFVLTTGYCMNQLTAGQTTTLWVALCMLMVWWTTQGKPRRAGLALAAGVCVKVVPLCFLPYLVLRGQRRVAVISFAGSLLALLLLPAVWVGWDANSRLLVQWSQHLFDTLTPDMFSDLRNQSLLAILVRFLSPTQHGVELANLDISSVGRVWLAASCLLAAAMYGWFLLALRSPKADRREATILALLLIFMTACNPLGWRQNGVALIFPYFLVLDSIARSLERRRTLLALFIPSVLLIYVKGDGTAFSDCYLIQVYGGRFWANILLAAAVLTAYYAANSQSSIRIASLPEVDRQPAGSREATSPPTRKAAA